MRRFNHLLAGASWMAEYGDPGHARGLGLHPKVVAVPESEEDVTYPKAYFWTTTRDDRVHPAHARKMAARMDGAGSSRLLLRTIEGGHGSGVVNQQRAYTTALEYAYLWKMLR